MSVEERESLPPFTADPRDCPCCGGTMEDVGENSVVEFECRDCLARLKSGLTTADERTNEGDN